MIRRILRKTNVFLTERGTVKVVHGKECGNFVSPRSFDLRNDRLNLSFSSSRGCGGKICSWRADVESTDIVGQCIGKRGWICRCIERVGKQESLIDFIIQRHLLQNLSQSFLHFTSVKNRSPFLFFGGSRVFSSRMVLFFILRLRFVGC